MLPRRSAPAPPGPPTSASSSSSYADVAELDKYKLVSNIGKGSFGVISKVQRLEDGREFALKQLDYAKMTDKDRKQILAEVAVMESLKHRNIVQLIQKIKDPKNERIYIIMEYCTSGDLGTLIRKAARSNTPLNEDKIWNIFLQIVQALHHCHWPEERSASGSASTGRAGLSNRAGQGEKDKEARYQVMHRDLKPENVFLSDDFVKLGDFGLSKDMGTAAFTSTYVGTPLYMPPEILSENKYDMKSDIWSLGCLVFEMCALVSPFSTATTQTELITLVRSGRIPPIPNQYSATLKGVVKAMLTLNRPTTKDLLELEEMKLHRKLFSVQNQTQLLVTKKDELRRYEEALHHRSTQLNDREEVLHRREAAMVEREEACRVKEEEAGETQKRLNHAAETLRTQWEKLREEKASLAENGMPVPQEHLASRRPSMPPMRPPLEERATMPLPAIPRPNRPQHTFSYDDTPSKIPIPTYATPSSFFSSGLTARHASTSAAAAGSLRRNASKSLGNLAARAQAEARADADRASSSATSSVLGDATPAKQVRGGHIPKRSSIGSPNDLQRQYNQYAAASARAIGGGGEYYSNWTDDVSMASPAISVGSPFVPIRRKSTGVGSKIFPITASGIRPSNSASSQESMSSAESGENIQVLVSGTTYSQQPSWSGPSSMNQTQHQGYPTPVAKWSVEDPDLPSPFLRRMSTAPVPPTFNRQPLGMINVPQPPIIAPGAVGGGGQKKGSSLIPRSRSGTLHQHVLKHNAAQAQQGQKGTGTGVRGQSTRPNVAGR